MGRGQEWERWEGSLGKGKRVQAVVGVWGEGGDEKEPWLGDEVSVLGKSRCGERLLLWDLAMT